MTKDEALLSLCEAYHEAIADLDPDREYEIGCFCDSDSEDEFDGADVDFACNAIVDAASEAAHARRSSQRLLSASEDPDDTYPRAPSRSAVSSPQEAPVPRFEPSPAAEAGTGSRYPVAHAAKEAMGVPAAQAVMNVAATFGLPETWSVAKVGGLWAVLDKDGDPLVLLPARYASEPEGVALLAGLVSGYAACVRLFRGELEPEEPGKLRLS